MSAENEAKVRRLLEAINTGKMETFDELIAAEYVYHEPGTPEMRGPEGVKQLVGMYRAAFPDIHMHVEDMFSDGDKVVTRWGAHGTHRGELMGIPPTGKEVTVTGMIIDRFSGGKIVEEWENFDAMGMMQQLGVIPK